MSRCIIFGVAETKTKAAISLDTCRIHAALIHLTLWTPPGTALIKYMSYSRNYSYTTNKPKLLQIAFLLWYDFFYRKVLKYIRYCLSKFTRQGHQPSLLFLMTQTDEIKFLLFRSKRWRMNKRLRGKSFNFAHRRWVYASRCKFIPLKPRNKDHWGLIVKCGRWRYLRLNEFGIVLHRKVIW